MYLWNDPHASQRLQERSGLRRNEIESCLIRRRYVVSEWYHGKPVEQHFVWDWRRERLIRVPVTSMENGDSWIPTILPVDDSGQYGAWRLAEAERAWRGDAFYREPYGFNGRIAVAEVGIAKSWIMRSGHKNYRHLAPLFSWCIRDKKMARPGEKGVVELFRDREFCMATRESILTWRPEMATLLNGGVPEIYIIKPGAHRYIPFEFFLSTP